MTPHLGDHLVIAELELGDIDVAHCPSIILTQKLVNAVQKKNKKIHASDCNTEKDLVKAFVLRVDQISTDQLALALKIKKEFAATHNT